MIFNKILPKKVSILQCGTDITMTDGSTTTRTINLASVWDYQSLTVSNIYIIPKGSWTYGSSGTNVSAISYAYTASTGVLTMTTAQAILNADWSFDAESWMVIIIRS